MVKTVFGLLSEIYNGNFYLLPEKITVNNIVYHKDNIDKEYYDDDFNTIVDNNNRNMDNEHIFKLKVKKVVEEVKENKRWKPEIDEAYYCIDYGDIDLERWDNDETDQYRYDIRNCFKTQEEAQQHLDNIKTYYELKDLAEELNNGKEIDWKDNDQNKYFIYYDTHYEKIKKDEIWTDKQVRQIYCLDENFLDKAIQRIGEDRLIKLFN